MFAINFDFNDFEKYAEHLAVSAPDQMRYSLALTLNESVVNAREAITQEWMDGFSVRAPNFPKVALHMEFADKDNLEASITDTIGRANLSAHNPGGTVLPKTKPHFAVPLTGKVRKRAHGESPLDLRGAVLLKRGGKTFVMVPTGRGRHRRLEAVYVLKDKVELKKDWPASDVFETTVREEARVNFPGAVMRAMLTRR